MTSPADDAALIVRRFIELRKRIVGSGKDEHELIAALETVLARLTALNAELSDMRAKMRNIISHATGGHTGDEDCPDLSLNEISVRISQFRTRLWNDAKELGAKEANAELSERIEEEERLRGALSKVKVLIVKQYEFDKSNEDGSPYREGAADSSCDLLNDAVPIIDAALSTPSRGGR